MLFSLIKFGKRGSRNPKRVTLPGLWREWRAISHIIGVSGVSIELAAPALVGGASRLYTIFYKEKQFFARMPKTYVRNLTIFIQAAPAG